MIRFLLAKFGPYRWSCVRRAIGGEWVKWEMPFSADPLPHWTPADSEWVKMGEKMQTFHVLARENYISA